MVTVLIGTMEATATVRIETTRAMETVPIVTMRVITIVHTEIVEDIIGKNMTVMRTVPVERTTTNNTETIGTQLLITRYRLRSLR